MIKASDLTLIYTAEAVPREDLKKGMTVHAKQMLTPTPEEVAEKAFAGLSMKGIAAYFGMHIQTLHKNFPRTLATARAQGAIELLDIVRAKAGDSTIKGDIAALKILLQRLDPEEKEPTIVIAQQINVSDKLIGTSINDINNLLISYE